MKKLISFITLCLLFVGVSAQNLGYAGTNDSFTAYVRRLNFKFVK